MSNKPAKANRSRSKRPRPASKPVPHEVVAAEDVNAIVRKLGRWYDRNKRDLPWRRSQDPYAIWVSEIMLQQTRVDTVKDYYLRFLDRFPNVEALAAADMDEVLQRWQGLGYYRRARQLHRAAGEVVDAWEGRLPPSAAELQSLSGVGRYTAGAIASIAYGEAAPIVDGNVIRVFSRLFAVFDDMGRAPGRRRIWSLAEQLVPKRRPGRFNQAVMELGALVCTPRAPNCGACPLRSLCRAKDQGCVEELPQSLAKAAVKKQELTALVFEKNGRCLLARRRAAGLFGGMWEPPMVDGKAVDETRCRDEFGILAASEPEKTAQVKHLLSHRALRIEVRRCSQAVPVDLGADHAVYDKLQLCAPEQVALSTLAKKVLRSVGAMP